MYAVPLWSALLPQVLAIVVLVAAARVRGPVPWSVPGCSGPSPSSRRWRTTGWARAALLVLSILAAAASPVGRSPPASPATCCSPRPRPG